MRDENPAYDDVKDESDRLLDAKICNHSYSFTAEHHTWRYVVQLHLTLGLLIVQFWVGYKKRSPLIQADAFWLLSSFIAICIGMVTHIVSDNRPDARMSFGWGRLATVGGLLNATYMIAICILELFESIEILCWPEESMFMKESAVFFKVAAASIVVNLIGVALFYRERHIDNADGVYHHLLTEVVTSFGTLISTGSSIYMDYAHCDRLDAALSILSVLFMFFLTKKLLVKTAKNLLEAAPKCIDIEEVEGKMMRIPGVKGIHEFHLWDVGNYCFVAQVHIVIDSVENRSRIDLDVHALLCKYLVYSVTTQFEYVDGTNACNYDPSKQFDSAWSSGSRWNSQASVNAVNTASALIE